MRNSVTSRRSALCLPLSPLAWRSRIFDTRRAIVPTPPPGSRALAPDLAARDADDPWLCDLKGLSSRAEGYLAARRGYFVE